MITLQAIIDGQGSKTIEKKKGCNLAQKRSEQPEHVIDIPFIEIPRTLAHPATLPVQIPRGHSKMNKKGGEASQYSADSFLSNINHSASFSFTKKYECNRFRSLQI
jgi:hypothetical protein